MPHLAPIHYATFHKFLQYVGCEFQRKKGSHLIYKRFDLLRPIVIPERKSIPVFIIKNNLKLLNISNEKYLQILEKL